MGRLYSEFRKMFLKVFLFCCVSYTGGLVVIDLCKDEFCTTERSLEIEVGEVEVEFRACSGDLVHLEFLPGTKTEGWIRLSEAGRKLFYKAGFESSDDIELLSSANNLTLEHGLKDFLNFDIRYSCQPSVKYPEETIHYGKGNKSQLVDANQVVTYDLRSNDEILHLDIGLEFPSPIAGFAAVDLGDGKWGIGFNQLSLSVENGGDTSRDVKILTSNILMSPPGLVQMSYDLGEDHSVVSSTPPASTTTTPSEEKISTVYLVSVLEDNFVQNKLQDFKNKTWSIMREGCPDLGPENQIHYSPAFSCRQVCSMSRGTERGCVMIKMHLEDIPVSTYCPNTGDLSRMDYFRSKLRDMSGEFRAEYDAGRVSVDTCNDIGWTTQWIWISVGLVVSVFSLSVMIMLTKRWLTRRGVAPLHTEDDDHDGEKLRYKTTMATRFNEAFEIEE